MLFEISVSPRNKKGPGKSINFEFDTIMHPKVEVTQVEDAASAAASGSSENDSINDLQDDFSVMVIGILTGGLIAFSLLAFVGFMVRRCVHRHRNTTTAMMCSNVNRATLVLQNEGKKPTVVGVVKNIYVSKITYIFKAPTTVGFFQVLE